MISIVKNESCEQLQAKKNYSLYINETLKASWHHIREPADLAQLLREAADAVDLANGITPPHLEPKKPPKLSMMDRMNGIQHHLEKSELNY